LDEIHGLAASAAAAGNFERARRLYDEAIALNPAHAESYYKRGNALKNLQQREAALASYDRAIELEPQHAHAYCNRGVVQQSLGWGEAALSSYDRAIGLDAADAIAHYNRALLMQDFCRWDEALIGYDRAVAIDPEFADAQYNRAMALLFLGDFENGWRGFEWRWKNAQRLGIGAPREFTQPLWLGEESIAGKRVLLYSEGGLGDTLQFCRYATLLRDLGATVLLEVQRPLTALLATLDGASQVIGSGSSLPPFDSRCPLMSLPLALKTRVDTIPASPKYLYGDSVKMARWRARLGERRRPRIGLVWSGNPNNTIDPRRSIDLADWLPYLPAEFHYVCLQKDIRTGDQETLAANRWISRFDGEFDDFADTAALCECLDLVVSVDTSVAHLSGALGRPTWILLPFTPDWRWFKDGTDTPWYPTAKLYRQTTVGDWKEVFARIAAQLRREFRVEGLT